jgi:chorismate mutase
MNESANLSHVRREIDSIDHDLIELLARRQGLVEEAGHLKQGQPQDAVKAPDRVGQVIAARRSDAEAAGLDPDVAEHVWRAMIDAFIELEMRVHAQGQITAAK